MPDESNQGRSWVEGTVRSITAVSTTVVASLLIGFIAVVQSLSEQAPLITSHMQVTNQKLSAIENEQSVQNRAMAALLKDYTSREQLQQELDKLNDKIRNLQVQQAVMQQALNSIKDRG